MASAKKRRKLSSLSRLERKGGNHGVHPDGDRRRRGGMRAEDAIARKRAMQQLPVLPLPEGPQPER